MKRNDSNTGKKHYPKVAIIVLAFNGLKWIDECLQCLSKTKYPNYKIIVVDNKSKDETVLHIRKNYPFVDLLENDKNYGTSEGNNKGIRYALKDKCDYVVLLNQDIKVMDGWLTELIKVAEEEENIGILSSIQYDYKGEGIDPIMKELLVGTDYYKDLKNNALKKVYDYRYIIGASMLIKKELIEKIGLFDPAYFVYVDDPDYCRRAIYRGFRVGIATNSFVLHNHTQVAKKSHSKTTSLFLRKNQMMFMLKNPNRYFYPNLREVFVRTNWYEHFSDVNISKLKVTWLYIYLLMRVPLMFIKYKNEKIRPCYV